MSERVIIENQSDLSLHDAIRHVLCVIQEGRISETRGEKHHCHLTQFYDGICVAVFLNKRSERFVVYRQEARR